LFESISFYINLRQLKAEWGISRREGEREKERNGLREYETELR
jgi:hypothetical protein